MNKILIVDFSPFYIRHLFSSLTYAKNTLKLKPVDGIYDFNEFKDVFIFKVFDDLKNFKGKFKIDEIVLGVDTPKYWRKDFWDGYKYGRKKSEELDWNKVSETVQEILDVLDKYSSSKVIRCKGAEGDDVAFVLSEYLCKDNEIIIQSLDHDLVYCTLNENTKYWQTKFTTKDKSCAFVEKTLDEINELKFEHCFYGDKGDNILPVTAYTVLSDKCKEIYPDLTPEKIYPRRHEFDVKFAEKYDVSAFKHPRFGKSSFEKKMKKEGFTYKDFMKKNPIHIWNFKLNKKISLPDGIPDDIKSDIINSYDISKSELNPGEMTQYFMKYQLVNLIGIIGLL